MAKKKTPRGKQRSTAQSPSKKPQPTDTTVDDVQEPSTAPLQVDDTPESGSDGMQDVEHAVEAPADGQSSEDDDADAGEGDNQEDDGGDSDGAGDDDDDDDDDETAIETVALSDIPQHTIVEARNDVPAIQKKLTDIALFNKEAASKPLPFWESLSVPLPIKVPLSHKLALDDLEREKKFAELTAAAVHTGLDRLRDEGVRFRRPSDFFAEMAKSDEQMGKVKAQILFNKERIEAAEKRRNNRNISKNRKKIRQEQIEKEQSKKRKTREEIEAYSMLRQQRLKQRAEGDDASDDDEFPIDMLDVEQLDEENRFQKQKDIASGKKKAWRPSKDDAMASKGGRENGRGRGKGGRDQRNSRPGNRDQKPGGRNVRQGGIQKNKKGPKKRLGKSRRVSTKGKA